MKNCPFTDKVKFINTKICIGRLGAYVLPELHMLLLFSSPLMNNALNTMNTMHSVSYLKLQRERCCGNTIN